MADAESFHEKYNGFLHCSLDLHTLRRGRSMLGLLSEVPLL
jgi:hypothetical protein